MCFRFDNRCLTELLFFTVYVSVCVSVNVSVNLQSVWLTQAQNGIVLLVLWFIGLAVFSGHAGLSVKKRYLQLIQASTRGARRGMQAIVKLQVCALFVVMVHRKVQITTDKLDLYWKITSLTGTYLIFCQSLSFNSFLLFPRFVSIWNTNNIICLAEL